MKRGRICEGSQEGRLLALLQSGREVTPIEALQELGCFRLAARVRGLRTAGYDIRARTLRGNGKHYAAYSLHRSIVDLCHETPLLL